MVGEDPLPTISTGSEGTQDEWLAGVVKFQRPNDTDANESDCVPKPIVIKSLNLAKVELD